MSFINIAPYSQYSILYNILIIKRLCTDNIGYTWALGPMKFKKKEREERERERGGGGGGGEKK